MVYNLSICKFRGFKAVYCTIQAHPCCFYIEPTNSLIAIVIWLVHTYFTCPFSMATIKGCLICFVLYEENFIDFRFVDLGDSGLYEKNILSE